MFRRNQIFYLLSLILAGCLGQSSADEDYHPGIGVPRLSFAISSDSVYLGGSEDLTVTITNLGRSSATSLSLSGITAPFAYKGGTFPGTGGTCGTSLNAGLSCTLILTFSPTATATQTASITVTYRNGTSTISKTATFSLSREVSVGASGSLDTQTFNSTGSLVQSGTKECRNVDIALQSDGKIVLHMERSVYRYNTDGSLDTTFDGDGIVATSLSGNPTYLCPGGGLAVQSDGKIVVGGSTSSLYSGITRLNTDGSLDTGFGTSGIASFGALEAAVTALTLRTNGNIIAVGNHKEPGSGELYLVEFDTTGTLVPGFGTSGVKTWGAHGNQYPEITDVKVLSSGKIVTTGPVEANGGGNLLFSVYRFTSTGAYDATFGSSGEVNTQLNGATYNSLSHSLAVQDDGKVIVSGVSYESFYYLSTARYDTNGVLDTTFSGDGIVQELLSGSPTVGGNVSLQSDGKILVAGTTRVSGRYNLLLVRYNSDGSLDTTFDTDGVAIVTLGSSHAYGTKAIPQSDGKWLIGGGHYNGSNYDAFLSRFWN